MSNRTDRAIEMLRDAAIVKIQRFTDAGDLVVEAFIGETRIKVKAGKGVYVYNPRNTNGLTKHAGSGNAFYVSTDRALKREVKALIRLAKKN